MQFQWFDNGARPGRGKTQHTITLEAYLEPKIDLARPHWKRSVALIEASDFRAWADKALEAGRLTADQHQTYADAAELMQEVAERPDTLWAKCGRIEDKRSHTDYPGQFLFAWREIDGPMQCHVVLNGDTISCERFQHDKYARPGTGRRKAYGFFDPGRIYERQKAEAEALESGRSLREVLEERGLTRETCLGKPAVETETSPNGRPGPGLSS